MATKSKRLNDLQLAVVAAYPDKDVAQFKTLAEVQEYGDTLFQFLVYEAGDAGDVDEYLSMVNQARVQVDDVYNALVAKRWRSYTDEMPLLDALWWYIENVDGDEPWSTDLFFRLRERARSGK